MFIGLILNNTTIFMHYINKKKKQKMKPPSNKKNKLKQPRAFSCFQNNLFLILTVKSGSPPCNAAVLPRFKCTLSCCNSIKMLVTLHTVHIIDMPPPYIALPTSQASLANSCCIHSVFHKLATPTH